MKKGHTIKRFVSHTKDVLAVAFSPDNRQIASGGRDKSLKIWNTVGECKFTVEQNAHTDWVSAVKFYQEAKTPIVVSASWDRTIKVWDNQTMTLKHTFVGHKAQINSLDMAPKTSYLASGGKDGQAIIWNLVEGKFLGQTEVDCPINCVLFAPKSTGSFSELSTELRCGIFPQRSSLQTSKHLLLTPTWRSAQPQLAAPVSHGTRAETYCSLVSPTTTSVSTRSLSPLEFFFDSFEKISIFVL